MQQSIKKKVIVTVASSAIIYCN